MSFQVERVPETGTASAGFRQRLEAIWETAPGIAGWFATVDHKEIGIRYIVTAFAFLLVGGIEALVMRLQLARPNETLLTPEQYDQLFSTHGVTMIFLYAMPILSGFSQLSLAAHSRRARHGLSACERLVLLALSGGGPLHVCRLRHRRGSERRLVQLRPLCEPPV